MKPPFIGRKEELELIAKLITQSDSTEIILIEGNGGVGKTRLLQEIQRIYSVEYLTNQVLVSEIIEYESADLLDDEKLRYQIASSIGIRIFADYFRSLDDAQKIKKIEVSPERIIQENQRVIEAFLLAFNKLSSAKRIVLLIDTVDKVTSEDLKVLRFVSQLLNVVVIIAGRCANQASESFTSACQIPLLPFSEQDALHYLLTKQEELHITLNTELISKLVLLTESRPILLDLSMEWLAQDNPPIWLVDESLEILKTISPEKLAARCQDFEYQLVKHLIKRKSKLDQVFLLLAKTGPLDSNGIREILRLTDIEATSIYNAILNSSATKIFPDGKVALHDEIELMVNNHVWKEIDSTGIRLKRFSQRAVIYFGNRIKNIQKEIAEYEKKSLVNELDTDQRLEFIWTKASKERELSFCIRQQLKFSLNINISNSLELFGNLYDLANTNNYYRRSDKQFLIELVSPHIDSLPRNLRFDYQIRLAQYLHQEKLAYLDEKVLLIDVLRSKELLPFQQIEALLRLGDSEIALGDFGAGLYHFGQAVQISTQYNLLTYSSKANNALGWAYRLTGQLEEAISCYQNALHLAIETNGIIEQATVLNNMAYVYALQQKQSAAIELSSQALNLWQEINNKRGIGIALGTLANILVQFNRFDDALVYSQKALDIFEKSNDLERLAKNYRLRGVIYWLLGKFNLAMDDLRRAQDIGLQSEKHIVLHYLAHVYKEQKSLDKALSLFEESYRISQRLPDPFSQLNNLGDIADSALCLANYSNWTEIEDKFIEFKRDWVTVRYDLPEGLLKKYLGDLALGDRNFEKAIEFYSEGLRLIALANGYGPYTLSALLQKTEQVFSHHVDYLGMIAPHLQNFWMKEKLYSAHPEALLYFARWKKMEKHDETPE